MSGKDYSEQAYHISMQFEELATSSKENWKDEQATRFGDEYVEPISKALREMQLPIEHIVDIVDRKLQEIRSIATRY